MNTPNTLWVSYWSITWLDFPPSFGVIGLARSREAAEELLADMLVHEYQATRLPRSDHEDSTDWLTAMTLTTPEDATPSLRNAIVEYFTTEFHIP